MGYLSFTYPTLLRGCHGSRRREPVASCLVVHASLHRHAPRARLLLVLILAACDDDTPGTTGTGGGASTTTAGTTTSSVSTTAASTTAASTTASSSASTTATTGAGTGGAAFCTPGDTVSCYDGLPETLGVGVCVAGLATCLADGTAYGTCVGQVLPGAETCSNAGDEDCDGLVNEEGADCVCAPSSMVSCYTGPAGTQGVGACTGGLATCDASGLQLGPCMGEVVPIAENCATAADDDCDGTPNQNCCPAEGVTTLPSENCSVDYGEMMWMTNVPSPIQLLAAGPSGEAVAIMKRSASVAGYEPMPASANPSFFIARFAADGTMSWGKEGHGSTYPDFSANIYELNIGPTGNIALTSPLSGSNEALGLGSTPGPTAPFNFVRAIRVVAPNGTLLWAREAPKYGSLENSSGPHAVAAAADGGAYYLSDFTADHLVRFDATGAQVWDKTIMHSGAFDVQCVGTADNGVVISFLVGASIDVGAGPMTGPSPSLLLAKFSATGTLEWAIREPTVTSSYVYLLQIDGNEIVVQEGYRYVRASLTDGQILGITPAPAGQGYGRQNAALLGSDGIAASWYGGAKDVGLGTQAPYGGAANGMLIYGRDNVATRWSRAVSGNSAFMAGAPGGFLYLGVNVANVFDYTGVPETAPNTSRLLRLAP